MIKNSGHIMIKYQILNRILYLKGIQLNTWNILPILSKICSNLKPLYSTSKLKTTSIYFSKTPKKTLKCFLKFKFFSSNHKKWTMIPLEKSHSKILVVKKITLFNFSSRAFIKWCATVFLRHLHNTDSFMIFSKISVNLVLQKYL